MQDDTHAPPEVAARLLRRLVHADMRYAALGDFEELFSERVRRDGLAAARRWYWSEVFKSLPAFFLDACRWRLVMLRNHLKVARRNLARHKGYTFTNVYPLCRARLRRATFR